MSDFQGGGSTVNGSRLRAGLVTLGAAVLLVATACTSASSQSPVGEPSGGVDWQAQLEQYSAMTPAALESEARTLGASVERQLMTMSGLEKELGGAAAADAALAQVSAAMTTATRGFTSQPEFGRFGARIPEAGEESMGGLIFGNLMIVGLGTGAAVAATNDLKAGEPDSETSTSDAGEDGSGSFTVSGSTEKAQLDVGMEVTKAGVTGRLKTVVTVAPCPDPTGRFTATTTMSASVSKAGGTTGSSMTIEVTVTGQVDDDARLVSYDMDMRSQSAQFQSGKGQFLDLTLSFGQQAGELVVTRGTVNRMGGTVTEEFAREQAGLGSAMALLAKDKALEAAQKGWESGRCVALEPTTTPSERTGLVPSTTVTIVAAPRSKVDGSRVGGTVRAERAGRGSVRPDGAKVPADATFTYTAPDEKDLTGAVLLEARSKRGVAKADVYFDTKAGGYAVDAPYGASWGRIFGVICSLDEPFTLREEAPSVEMAGTFTFTPSSPTQGTWVYSGSAMGGLSEIAGSGTYLVAGVSEGRPSLTIGAGQWTQKTALGTYQTPSGAAVPLALEPAQAGCEQ